MADSFPKLATNELLKSVFDMKPAWYIALSKRRSVCTVDSRPRPLPRTRMTKASHPARSWLSSYWVHLVTPVPAVIARPLIQGLRNDVIVRDDTARRLFPQIKPMDYASAVHLALANLETGQVETAWSDALSSSQGDLAPVVLATQEGIILERRQRLVRAPAAAVYRNFSRLGGANGWLYMNWTWQIRGAMDRLLGGVGLRRGRRNPQEVRVGDAVDFWRVEAVEPDRLLRLRAEMKVPGRAWLGFRIEPVDAGSARLFQTAFFAPRGLSGLLDWYVLYPIHALIFSGLATKLALGAETDAAKR